MGVPAGCSLPLCLCGGYPLSGGVHHAGRYTCGGLSLRGGAQILYYCDFIPDVNINYSHFVLLPEDGGGKQKTISYFFHMLYCRFKNFRETKIANWKKIHFASFYFRE